MYIGFLNPQGNFDPADSYWMKHPDFGGQLVYVKETALGLADLGHRVDIITRQIHDPKWPEFSGKIDHYEQSDRVRIVRIPCGPEGFLPKEELWPYLGQDWLEGIIDFYDDRGEAPGVFTTHYADGGLVGALINERRRIPFTFTGHSLGAQKMDRFDVSRSNLEEMDDKFHFARRLEAERTAMSRASKIITSTNQERFNQYGHRAYKGAVSVEDDGKFAVIPPGVNRKLFNPERGGADDRIRSRIVSALERDIPEKRRPLPLVICSSRLDKKKNHVGLVDAFLANERLRNSANLAIVVRGAENPLEQPELFEDESKEILEEIRRKLTDGNLWEAVTSFPLENQKELAAAYRWGADNRSVFSLTSLYEPFGLAPLEAMSCGLPVVVTNKGGPTESLKNETGSDYGILVDPEDPDDVAEGLLKLLSSEKLWKKYQQLGIERVISRYTWKQTAKGYLNVARDISSGSSKTSHKLEIPDFFMSPTPENDITLERLKEIYFA